VAHTPARAGSYAAFVDRSGSRLEPVGLAWLGVWLEAALSRDSGEPLEPRGRRTDRGDPRGQRGGPLVAAATAWETRALQGDTDDHDPELRQQCHSGGWEWVATRRGPHPHGDGGVEARKIFYKLRSQAIEPFNGLCKNVLAWRVKMPVMGMQRAQLLAWGALVVSQLVVLYQHEHDRPLDKGIKPFLRAAGIMTRPLLVRSRPLRKRIVAKVLMLVVFHKTGRGSGHVAAVQPGNQAQCHINAGQDP